MQELRFVAVSEDGSYAVLAVPGRSARFILPIDERLRAVALGQTTRLAQYEIEVESPLRPKEIQARIRAGETAEEIADAAGIPVERVRWFEGPVLAERAYIAQQAQTATVRRQGDSAGPGPHLEDIVAERMYAAGADPDEGQWDSRKRGDGSWQVQLTYSAAGRLHIAEWKFDPRRRHVMPEDEVAARLSLPESELPPLPESMPGEATVTPIASRLGAAAGMGGGMSAGPSADRIRPERPAAPERPAPAAFREPEHREPERVVPPVPAPGSGGRRTGAPWSDSARRPESAPAAADPAPAPATTDPAPAAAADNAVLGEPVPRAEPAASGESAPATAEPAGTAGEEAAPAARASAPRKQPTAKKAATAKKATAVKKEATGAAATPATATDPGATDAAATAKEPAADEQPARPRPAKKASRNRRSSVPSWDEIMLGSSRQRD